jgi:hypothetical protein
LGCNFYLFFFFFGGRWGSTYISETRLPTMPADCPRLIRPIPRRPADLRLANEALSDEASASSSPLIGSDFNSEHLADPRQHGAAGLFQADSISRAASFMDLTAPTLFGIYSPAPSGIDGYYDDRDDPPTPWGVRARTPFKAPGSDEGLSELGPKGSSPGGGGFHDRSTRAPPGPPPSGTAVLPSLALRASLLFAFGVGYGLLVTRVHSDPPSSASFLDGVAAGPGYNWRYLAFWGAAGVVLGGLLPWFDGVWEDAFGWDENLPVKGQERAKKASPQMDWAPVVRCIGAFVGIAFAIVSPPPLPPSPPCFRVYLPAIAIGLTHFPAKTTVDFYNAGLADSSPRQPLPMVSHRSLQVGIPAVVGRRPYRVSRLAGAQRTSEPTPSPVLPKFYRSPGSPTSSIRRLGESGENRDGYLDAQRSLLQLCLFWKYRQAVGLERVSRR